MTTEVNKSGHVEALNFTADEIRGIEQHFNVKWEEMSDTGKMFKGLIYRHSLSPTAMANMIVGPSKVDQDS